MHKPDVTADPRGLLTLFQKENLESLTAWSHVYTDEEEARHELAFKRHRLLDVNYWDELGPPDPARTTFILRDGSGRPVPRLCTEGDFIEIHLPGHSAMAADWVRVEEVEDRPDHISVVVRPSHHPLKNTPHITEHFFSRATTNTFTLHRVGRMLVASVHGEHEYPNTDTMEAGGLLRAARNRIIADTGWGVGRPNQGVGSADQTLMRPQLGGQKGIWSTFCRSLLIPEGARSR